MGFPFIFFHMSELHRQQLIFTHKFYVEQAQKRLLLQFEDISSEADKFAQEWLSKADQWFDPNRHDYDDFQMEAGEESIHFLQLLNDMHDQTRLSVIAGMYHEWDKQLRDWLSMELGRTFKIKKTKAAIWGEDFDKIIKLLECFDWQVRLRPYFDQLNECRLVVNVYKHGTGSSLKKLKENHPHLLYDFMDGTMDKEVLDQYLDHKDLAVTDNHLAAFSDAIIEFWNDVPESTSQLTLAKMPEWLSDPIKKDL